MIHPIPMPHLRPKRSAYRTVNLFLQRGDKEKLTYNRTAEEPSCYNGSDRVGGVDETQDLSGLSTFIN